jgi:hypothetical protein
MPVVTFNDPVIVNDPVIIAEPVNGNTEPVATVIGNVVPFPLVNVIVFEDIEAVIRLLATNEAVDANELDKALVAKDAVPKNEPVIPAVTFNDPVIVAPPESTIRPFFILNSFGII